MQAARPDEAEASLLCRVGSCVCAFPLTHVRETMRPLPLEPLAGAPPFILGLAIIRGAVVPVVEAAQLLGVRRSAAPARFVTLAIGPRRVAVAVDDVIGMRRLARTDAEDPPPLLRDTHVDVVSAIGHLDAELLLVLRAACIVPEDLWERLDVSRLPS